MALLCQLGIWDISTYELFHNDKLEIDLFGALEVVTGGGGGVDY
jgi:hypothetical protein